MPKLQSLFEETYIPSNQDIVFIKTKTDLISQTKLEIDGQSIDFVDIYGQKDKKLRWASYFEGILSGLILVVSCISYCEMIQGIFCV